MSTTRNYVCQTQDSVTPSRGVAPARHLHPDHDMDSLVVGIGNVIPRWDVITQPGRKLLYYVRADTFPSDDAVNTATAALQAACDEWNNINLGLTFEPTADRASANFYLRYAVNSPSMAGVLAKAFFPNEVNQDVFVYSYAFEDDNPPLQKAYFLHELGHVLGLRHEFAITGDRSRDLPAEGEGAVQFMNENPKSVMSYTFPPTLQPSDITATQAFYHLPNGTTIGGEPITDYLPQLRWHQ